jgi:hypothetical protein
MTWQQENPGTCARCGSKLSSYTPEQPPLCYRCATHHTAPGGTIHAPYRIIPKDKDVGGPFKVVNDIGEVKGTHDTWDEARQQQEALYAVVPGAAEMAKDKKERRDKKDSALKTAVEWSDYGRSGVDAAVASFPGYDLHVMTTTWQAEYLDPPEGADPEQTWETEEEGRECYGWWVTSPESQPEDEPDGMAWTWEEAEKEALEQGPALARQYGYVASTASNWPGPCPCECNSGGFCGGCGHAGCGGRRNASGPEDDPEFYNICDCGHSKGMHDVNPEGPYEGACTMPDCADGGCDEYIPEFFEADEDGD